MKKNFTTLILVASGLAFAQVGINAGTEATDPHQLAGDAVFHVENKANDHKGVLLPSVGLTSATDQTTTSNGTVTKGLMVWNNGNAGLTPAGYYYWGGTKWILTGNVDSSDKAPVVEPFTDPDYTPTKNADFVIFTPKSGGATINLLTTGFQNGKKICMFNNSEDDNIAITPKTRGQQQELFPNSGSCYVFYDGTWYGVGFY